MKDKAGLIVPVVLMLIGAYALLTALNSSEEQVALISDHNIPRGLAMMIGLFGLGGGAIVLFTALSNKRPAA